VVVKEGSTHNSQILFVTPFTKWVGRIARLFKVLSPYVPGGHQIAFASTPLPYYAVELLLGGVEVLIDCDDWHRAIILDNVFRRNN